MKNAYRIVSLFYILVLIGSFSYVKGNDVVLRTFLCWNMDAKAWHSIQEKESIIKGTYETFNYDVASKYKVYIFMFDPNNKPVCKKINDGDVK